MFCVLFFFFKQKTAYEMRISDWSSDVCSSDLPPARRQDTAASSDAETRFECLPQVGHQRMHRARHVRGVGANGVDPLGECADRVPVGQDMDQQNGRAS